MQILITIIRWFVGLLFIFSGIVKANDPLGLSYKMQEFFEAWGWHFLHNYTLFASVGMNILEVVIGVALIVGWQKRFTTWLLILLIGFFTFLTYYVLYSGKIKACGCFGDCIPLTPIQTFVKDIILLVLSIFLLLNLKHYKQIINQSKALILLLIGLFSTLGLQMYVLKNLPLADCLPYQKGNKLIEQMKIPENALPDSIVATSIYTTNGKEVTIIGDNFPDNFDSTFILKSREDVIVRKGNAEPKIKDFTLFSLAGTDTTNAIFELENYVLIVVNKLEEEKLMSQQLKSSVIESFVKKGLPIFIVTSNPNLKETVKLTNVNYLICDATVLKTAARVNTTYFLMAKDAIINKLSYTDASKLITQ